MVNTQIILSTLILLFSIPAAFFSFLIWRSNRTQGIYEQQEILKNSLEGREYTIQMPEEADVISHTIHVDRIGCSENDDRIRYKLEKSIFGSEGNTSINLKFEQVLRNHDGIPKSSGVPDMMEELRSHPWYNDANLLVHPPNRGRLIVDIHSSKPKVVENELSRLIETIEMVLVSKRSGKRIMVKNPER
ncbi:hypothetical protein [Halorussus ruber]|uniref:hypothetical protein n=1 Tax=Halorussus ruber TaxID=1126238 RepID=UPI0010925A27|nr:hypothetical protein [Halorussus ruber]